MKKRFLTLILTLTAMLTCIFGLTACSLLSEDIGHTHTYNKQIATEDYLKSEATCLSKAIYYKSCECGEKGTETFENGDLAEHQYNETKKSATQHWYECTCGAYETKENHNPGAEATETTDQICTECGYVITPALGHVHTLHLTKVDAKAQSCTEEGNIEYYTCTCGKWFTDSNATTEITDKDSVIIEKDKHNYGEWIEEISTVCGENGVKAHYHCSVCEQNFDSNYNRIENLTILATEEHNYGECITVQSGGCSAVSYKVKICLKCAHYVLDSDVDVDLVHPHEFELIEKKPNCTEDGIVYRFKCKNCNFVAAEELVDALGHDLPEYEYFNAGDTHYQICKRCEDKIHESHTCYDWTTIKEPNCYETGLAEGVCLKCGFDIEKVLPIVHDWEFTKYETEPTCTENGVSLYTCTICSTTKTETAYKLGHDHEFDSVIIAPTCTETGLDLYICSRCGDEKEKTTNSLGHDWDYGTITIEPDCYKTGNMHYECEREGCDATDDEVLAKKHTFDDGDILIEPSCTVNGKIKFTCQICQYSKELYLGVKHNTTSHAKVNATCTEDGNYKYWYCADCDKYFSDVDSESCYFSYDGRGYYFSTRIYTYQESTLNALTITKAGHDFPNYFNEYDEENHWQECLNGCGLTQNVNEHELEESYVVEVERVSGGYKHVLYHRWNCLHCDYYINGEMDESGVIISNDGTTIIHEHNTYEVIEPVKPTCNYVGYTAGLLCGECSEILAAPQEIPALGHNFVNSVCTRCGERVATKGLIYEFNSDKTGYLVSIGLATDKNIVIPSAYNGKPIVGIKENGFKNSFITNVTMYNTVTSIGSYAFAYCSRLSSITIPNSVTSIGERAFYDCDSLTSIEICASISNIGKMSFSGCWALTIYCEAERTQIGWARDWNDTGCPVVWSYNNNDCANDGYIYTIVDGIRYRIKNGVAMVAKQAINISAANIPAIITYKENDYSVTSIDYYAFSVCTQLSNIIVADNNENYKSINGSLYTKDGKTLIKYAVGKKANLFTIPNGVIYIAEDAFYGCTSLTSIVIPSSVESIGDYAFYDCDSLTSVMIGNSVTSIGDYAFYGCDSLISIIISDSVTSIGERAFYDCDSLTSVTIGNRVTSIGSYAFANCNSLMKVNYTGTIDSWAQIAFSDSYSNPVCYARNLHVNYVLLTDAILTSATKINTYAFLGCDSLISITIPNSITSIGDSAFGGCRSLTIYCEAESKPSDWSDSWNSSNCPVVWNYNNNDIATDGSIHTVIDGIKYGIKNGVATVVKQSRNIITANIPSTITYKGQLYSVTSIGDWAFYDCDSLTSVEIPDSVTSIGEDAFYDCDSLTIYCEAESNLSGWDSSWNSSNCPVVWNYNNNDIATDGSIHTVIDGIKYGIKNGVATVVKQSRNIITANIPSTITYKGQLYSVTGIGRGSFEGCCLLTYIEIPNSVTGIGDYAFNGCSSLTNIIIPDSVEYIGSTSFYGCDSLTSVVIPDSVTSIGYRAFSSCTSLVRIEVDENNLYYKDIDGNLYSKDSKTLMQYAIGKNGEFIIPNKVERVDSYAFADCYLLTNITIPNSVTSIGDYAFFGCSSLISIIIPDSVTSISSWAFGWCESLSSISIPKSVTHIGSYAFHGCYLLAIGCEAETKPDGWKNTWETSRLVVWGHKE